jgi:7-carboxy-7-deazaguanine synthase
MSAHSAGGTMLPVMESFYTIQGEGAFSGCPAYFIRLGGCDVGCFWCDVKESWDVESHPRRSIESILKEVLDAGAKIAVITGGEPAMHELGPLTSALQSAGIRTHIETSGAHRITGKWDWVTLSPKKFKLPLDENYQLANELKVIVYNKHDLIFAEEQSLKVGYNCLKLLQPEWDRRDEAIPQILNYVRDSPDWRLSLQTHKYIGVP